MSSDVTTTAHSSVTGVNNGSAITFAMETGEFQKLIPGSGNNTGINQFITSGTLFTRYGDRFDDVRYYTGDCVSGVNTCL